MCKKFNGMYKIAISIIIKCSPHVYFLFNRYFGAVFTSIVDNVFSKIDLFNGVRIVKNMQPSGFNG